MKQQTRWLQHNRDAQLNALPILFWCASIQDQFLPRFTQIQHHQTNFLPSLIPDNATDDYIFHFMKKYTESRAWLKAQWNQGMSSLWLQWTWNQALHNCEISIRYLATHESALWYTLYLYFITVKLVHIFAVHLSEGVVSASEWWDLGCRYVGRYRNRSKIAIHNFFRYFIIESFNYISLQWYKPLFI